MRLSLLRNKLLDKFVAFAVWMDRLKDNKKTLLALIGLDLFMAVGSNYADWPWLMSVKWYLLPFAPICSLYPLLLTVWFSLRYFDKKIPGWLTSFLFFAITSYGIMSYLYFIPYMSWAGIQFRQVGNIMWVTVYALQSFIILTDLKKLPIYQYLLVFAYFAAKDYSDRFLGSFWDIPNVNFPDSMINFFAASMVTLHLCAAASILILPGYISKIKNIYSSVPANNARRKQEAVPTESVS